MTAALSFTFRQHNPIPLNLSLRLPLGQTLVLFGPSGSGKSTILRSLAGLYQPQSGQIDFNGQSWLDTEIQHALQPQQRALGLVFQDDALFPHLSARQHIHLALQHLPPAQRDQTAQHWLERVHLAHRVQQYPAQLSGGERQRLGLARALARAISHRPGLLLLDEPFSAMDRTLKQQIYSLLSRLQAESQLSLVLVTHDLPEALKMANLLALIDGGECLQVDSPTALCQSPVNDKVACWLRP